MVFIQAWWLAWLLKHLMAKVAWDMGLALLVACCFAQGDTQFCSGVYILRCVRVCLLKVDHLVDPA